MKHLKEYNSWTTTATDNVLINYDDKKSELSQDVIDIIQYIEQNIDKIYEFRPEMVSFLNYDDRKYYSIRLTQDNSQKCISVAYRALDNSLSYYDIFITEYENKYLYDYFLKTFLNSKKRKLEVEKEKHEKELIKIKNHKILKDSEKYNL